MVMNEINPGAPPLPAIKTSPLAIWSFSSTSATSALLRPGRAHSAARLFNHTRKTSSRRLLLSLCALSAVTSPAATYHVDSENGDDAHEGTSIEQAWKSLE